MDNVKFKSSVAPSYYKASEKENGVYVPSEDDLYQTTETDVFKSLNELYFGKSAEGAGALNPFATLAKAQSVPFGYAVDELTGELYDSPISNPYYIPTLKVLVDKAADPVSGVPLTLESFEEIKTRYTDGLSARKAEKAKLEEMFLQGGLSPSDAKRIKQQINYLDKAIKICEEALAGLDNLKNEMLAMFQKEMEDVKKVMVENNLIEKFNSGSVQDKNDIITKYLLPLDHGDMYLGDPSLGITIVDTETQGKALWDNTNGSYIIRFSANGLPVSDKQPLPTEPWNIAGPGLMNTGIAATGGDDSVFKIDDAMPVEDGNIADAKVQINVPEYIVVHADKAGDPIETTNTVDDETHYVPAEPEDKTTIVAAPTDPGKYTAVRITKVEVVSDDGNGYDVKSDGDGYDMIYKFWAGDAVAYQIRVKGDSSPASDYAHAINGPQAANGDYLPITIDASGAIFTGRHEISKTTLDELRAEYLATDDDITGKAEEGKSDQALAAFNETMDKFKMSNIHVNEDSDETTGIIIQGRGHFIGAAKANNLFLVKSPERLKGEDDPLKATIIENGAGDTPFHNAVFAKGNGDIYATNVTLAHIRSEDPDANIGITMKAKMRDEKAKGDVVDTTVNVKLYASIMGPADNKWIDNPSDVIGDKNAKEALDKANGDDYFHSLGDEIKYSNPALANDTDGELLDPDASSPEQSTLSAEEILGTHGVDFDTAMEELNPDLESPYTDPDPPEGGDYYESIKDAQKVFFTEISGYFGFGYEGTSEGDGEEVDTSDIENPEKDKEVKI